MRAVVVEDARKVVIREIPEPGPLGAYDARVKVICGSLCNSTDLKIAHRELWFVTDYPTILGHEVVGQIIEVGPKARHLHLGELVSRSHVRPAEDSGLFEHWGGFAEYGLVTDIISMREDGLTQAYCDRLTAPADFDPVALTQMVTLRETLAFLRALGVQAGQSLLIFGAGPVGVSFSLMAHQLGLVPVIVVGRRQEPLKRALSFGRATHVIDNTRERVPEVVLTITKGMGVDWAIEAIGTDKVLPDAFSSLGPAGQVGLYGVPAAKEVDSQLRKSDRIKRVGFSEETVHKEVLEWVTRGLIPAREFVSHELPMEEINQGLELLEQKEAFKVLLWIAR